MEKSREKCGGWTDKESIIAARSISSFPLLFRRALNAELEDCEGRWKVKWIYLPKLSLEYLAAKLLHNCYQTIVKQFSLTFSCNSHMNKFARKFLMQQAVFLMYIYISSTCWTPFINVSVDIENIFLLFMHALWTQRSVPNVRQFVSWDFPFIFFHLCKFSFLYGGIFLHCNSFYYSPTSKRFVVFSAIWTHLYWNFPIYLSVQGRQGVVGVIAIKHIGPFLSSFITSIFAYGLQQKIVIWSTDGRKNVYWVVWLVVEISCFKTVSHDHKNTTVIEKKNMISMCEFSCDFFLLVLSTLCFIGEKYLLKCYFLLLVASEWVRSLW